MSCGWEDPPLEGVMVSNLPLLFANGLPTSLEKMSVGQLRNFIPFMMKCSFGREVKWDSCSVPEWWPKEVHYSAASIQGLQRPLLHHPILANIVQCCYNYHGCEYLLQFCTQLAQCSGYRFHDNWDGTTSMYDGTSGKLLVTFRNENRDYDKKVRELTASTSRRNLMPRNLAHPANPAAKSAPAMVQPPVCDVYLCDTCDAEFTSLRDVREHERVCGQGQETTPEPSDEEEEEVEEALDQVQFLSYLQIQPAPHTEKTPYVSPRKKLQKPVKRSFGSSYHRYSNVAFTSQMGQYILKNSKVGSNVMTKVNIDRYERYCGGSSAALKQRAMDRLAGLDKWPVTYRPARLPSGKKRVEVWTHLYSFTKSEWNERIRTIKAGLNKRARRLKRLCRKVKVVFHRLTEEEIEYWTRPANLPVIIDITGNTPVAQILTPVKHRMDGAHWAKSNSPMEILGVPSRCRSENILGIPWPSELEVKRVTVSNLHSHTNGPGKGVTGSGPVSNSCRPVLQSQSTASNKVIEFDGITVIDLCSSSEEEEDEEISFKHFASASEQRLMQQPLASSTLDAGKERAVSVPANSLAGVAENKVQGSSFNSCIKPERDAECRYKNHKDVLPKNGFSHWPHSESVQQRQLMGHSEELAANGSFRLSDISSLYPNRLALVRVSPDIVVMAKLKQALMLKCCSIVLEDVEEKEYRRNYSLYKSKCVGYGLDQNSPSELQSEFKIKGSQQKFPVSCTDSRWFQSDSNFHDAGIFRGKTSEKRTSNFDLTNPTPSKVARVEFLPSELTLVPQMATLKHPEFHSSAIMRGSEAAFSRNTEGWSVENLMQMDKIVSHMPVEELAGIPEQIEVNNVREMEKSDTSQLEMEEKLLNQRSRKVPCFFDEETVLDCVLAPSYADDDDVISFNPKYQLIPEYMNFMSDYQKATEDVSFNLKYQLGIEDKISFNQECQMNECDVSFNRKFQMSENDEEISFHPKYQTLTEHEDNVSFHPKYQAIAQYKLDDVKEDGNMLKTLLSKSAEFLRKFWKVNNSELNLNQKITKETVVSQFMDNNVGPELVLKEKLLGNLETEVLDELSSRADDYIVGKQLVPSNSDSLGDETSQKSQTDKPCSIVDIIREMKIEFNSNNRKENVHGQKSEGYIQSGTSQPTNHGDTSYDYKINKLIPLELISGDKTLISCSPENQVNSLIKDFKANIPVSPVTEDDTEPVMNEDTYSGRSMKAENTVSCGVVPASRFSRNREPYDINQENKDPSSTKTRSVGTTDDFDCEEAASSWKKNGPFILQKGVESFQQKNEEWTPESKEKHGITARKVRNLLLDECKELRSSGLDVLRPKKRQTRNGTVLDSKRIVPSKELRYFCTDEGRELRSKTLNNLRLERRRKRNTFLNSGKHKTFLNKLHRQMSGLSDSEQSESQEMQKVVRIKELKNLIMDECKELRSSGLDNLRFALNTVTDRTHNKVKCMRRRTIQTCSKHRHSGKRSVMLQNSMKTALKAKSDCCYMCIPPNDYPREMKQFEERNKHLKNLQSKDFSHSHRRHLQKDGPVNVKNVSCGTENKGHRNLALRRLKKCSLKLGKYERGSFNKTKISSGYKRDKQNRIPSNIPQDMKISVISYNKKHSIEQERSEGSEDIVPEFSLPRKKHASLINELQSLFLDECKELRSSGLEDLNSFEERLTRRGTVFQENDDKDNPKPRQRILIRVLDSNSSNTNRKPFLSYTPKNGSVNRRYEGKAKYPEDIDCSVPVVHGTRISIYRTENIEKPHESHKRMLKSLSGMCVLSYEMPSLSPSKSDIHTKECPGPDVAQRQLHFS